MVYKCIICDMPREAALKPLSKPSASRPTSVWSSVNGISSAGLHKCLTTGQDFCAVSSGSVNSYEPREMLLCNSKLLSLKSWEEGSDHHFSDCRVFSARSEAITQSWMEIHMKKEHNLQTDQAKRKITVPLCCHPDKLSLRFREFLTQDKQGTNCKSLASQQW